MGKNVKRRIAWFAAYDRCGMESYLEKMAAKGWLLDKIDALGWRYHRVEPAKIHFAVTYFADASAFDPVPTLEQESYWYYCEKAGWHLAAESVPMQVFYNTAETPVPIETDAEIQVANIHRTMKKTHILVYSFLLVMGLINFCVGIWNAYEDPAGELAKNLVLAQQLLYGFLIFFCISQLCSYFLWYHRARKAALLSGSFYEKAGNLKLQEFYIFLLILTMLFLAYAMATSGMIVLGLAAFLMPAIIAYLTLLMKKILKKKGFERENNRAISYLSTVAITIIVVSVFITIAIKGIDEGWVTGGTTEGSPPFLANDLMATDASKYTSYCDKDESILLERIDVENNLKENGEEVPQLRYTLTKIKTQAVYNLCLNGIFRENSRRQEEIQKNLRPIFVLEKDASLWDAEKVYQEYNMKRPMGNYIICWKDRIAELQLFWQPTEQQLRTMAERLKQF